MVGQVAADRSKVIVALKEQLQTDHRLRSGAVGVPTLPPNFGDQLGQH